MEIPKYIEIRDISMETIRKLTYFYKDKITNKKKTEYDSELPPYIELQMFIMKIKYVCKIHNWNFVMGFMLLDKLLGMNPEISLNTNNIHRLLLVSIMIQNKYSEDAHYDNIHWAKVLNLSITKINELEVKFLCDIGFNLNITFPDILIFLIEKSLFINNDICETIRTKLDDDNLEYKLTEFMSDIKEISKDDYKYDNIDWYNYLKYHYKFNILIISPSPSQSKSSLLNYSDISKYNNKNDIEVIPF